VEGASAVVLSCSERDGSVDADGLHKCFPFLHRFAHFGEIRVEVVRLFHFRSGGSVIYKSLRDVRADFHSAKVCPERPAQIMKGPRRNVRKLVEFFLALRPTIKRPLDGRAGREEEFAFASIGRDLRRYKLYRHGPDRERVLQVVLGQRSGQGNCLLVVRVKVLQQRRDFAAALAGEHDELHDDAEDAIEFTGRTPHCAQLVIGQDAFASHFLALLVVLQGIGFEAALVDCPVEENLGVDSSVVLLRRGVLQPCQFLGNIQLGNVAEIGVPKREVSLERPGVFMVGVRASVALHEVQVLIDRLFPRNSARLMLAERALRKDDLRFLPRLGEREGRVAADGPAPAGAQKNDERSCTALADANPKMFQRAVPNGGGATLGKLGSFQRRVGEHLMLWH